MKKIRLFQLASVFALALLVGFAYASTSTNNSKIVKTDNIETMAMADMQTNFASLDNSINKCGDGKCGEGKCGDGKTTDKKKTTKKSKDKKNCDKKTDKKTTTTNKCGGC